MTSAPAFAILLTSEQVIRRSSRSPFILPVSARGTGAFHGFAGPRIGEYAVADDWNSIHHDIFETHRVVMWVIEG